MKLSTVPKLNRCPVVHIITTPSLNGCVADTGVTVVCCGPSMMGRLGVIKQNLIPATITLGSAAKRQVAVLGCVPIDITLSCESSTVSTHELLYIVNGLSEVFLDRDCVTSLGCIPQTFPLPEIPNLKTEKLC